MEQKPVIERAELLGLTVELRSLPGEERSLAIHKGAKQVFTGTEADAVSFLDRYEAERPGLYEGSMYGYKE